MVKDNSAALKFLVENAPAIEAELCGRSLAEFVARAWPIINPSTDYIDNWHIGYICEHLQAVSMHQIRRLAIEIEPRCMKSTLVSIMWPTWHWTQKPGARFLFASHSETLSTKHSLDRRAILMSAWYQERWGDTVQLAGDNNLKTEYSNTAMGVMRAMTVASNVTGFGGNFLVADDLVAAVHGDSEAYRDAANTFFDRSFYDRLDNKKEDAIVVIMQRLHTQDLIGHIQATRQHDDWTFLTIPTTAEHDERIIFPLSGQVVERKEGDLLWPEREGPEELAAAKERLGSYGYCTPGETPILMADWTIKPINTVKVGDRVIGFERGNPAKRARLKVAEVQAVYSPPEPRPVVKVTMESGRTVRCTPDHEWYTARQDDGHRPYMPPVVGRRLLFVCPPYDEATSAETNLWHYLAGIVDGEGSITNPSALSISQSPEANGPVFDKIKATLDALGLGYSIFRAPGGSKTRPNGREIGIFQVRNIFDVYRKLIRIAKPAKADQMAARMIERGHMFVQDKDRIETIEPDGCETVYGLTTETGNYVAWGYASKNSAQYQQNPVPREGALAKREWFKIVPAAPAGIKQLIRRWDLAATEVRPGKDPDYTASCLGGMLEGVFYILHMTRDRLSPMYVEALVKQCAQLDTEYVLARKTHLAIWMEQEPGSSGVNTIDNYARHVLPGYDFHGDKVTGNKFERGAAFLAAAEMGNVCIVEGPWNEPFLDEMSVLGVGAHDDLYDTADGCFTQANAQRQSHGGRNV